jgi:hypothetical protein
VRRCVLKSAGMSSAGPAAPPTGDLDGCCVLAIPRISAIPVGMYIVCPTFSSHSLPVYVSERERDSEREREKSRVFGNHRVNRSNELFVL